VDSALAASFVQALKFRRNPSRPFRLIVIHDMEAPEDRYTTAEDVARYFQSPNAGGSAHYNVDRDSIVQSVYEADQAAAAPGSNTDGIHIELAGYARQTRDEWLDPVSTQILARAAALVRDIGARLDIPLVWLTDDEVRAGVKGITTHAAISRIYRQSDHTDPGPNFPDDVFMGLVTETPQEDDDMTRDELIEVLKSDEVVGYLGSRFVAYLADSGINPGTVPSPNVTEALRELQANTRALLAAGVATALDEDDILAIVQGLQDNLGDEIARSIGEKLVGG
jgi:hypothetical protein